MDSNIMVVKNVEKIFPTPTGDFHALKDISIEVPKGKLTILRGRSGSGKTTLLNILGALDYPSSGSVELDGTDIAQLDEDSRAGLRRTDIGFVFQSVALIPIMTAVENVEFALRMTGYTGDRRKRAMECLSLVGLSQRADHMPAELSGGEQQRVAIARAIAHRPKILFADEPTGALDTASGLKVVKIFTDLTDSEGVTIVMTTHDVGLMDFGNRIFELEGGELVNG